MRKTNDKMTVLKIVLSILYITVFLFHLVRIIKILRKKSGLWDLLFDDKLNLRTNPARDLNDYLFLKELKFNCIVCAVILFLLPALIHLILL